MLSIPNYKAMVDYTERFRKLVSEHPSIKVRVDNLPDNKEDSQFIADYLFLSASESVPLLLRRISMLEEMLKEAGINPDENKKG